MNFKKIAIEALTPTTVYDSEVVEAAGF